MRPLLFLVVFGLVASVAVVVGEAAAQGNAAQPATQFTLVAHQEGSSYYFTLEGGTQRNPTLVVPPNAQITVTLKGGGGVHNVQVQGQPASDYVNAEGDEVTYTFTSPASGTVQYWCVPHRTAGMVGQVRVAAPAGEGGEGGQAGGGEGGAPAPAAPTEYTFVAHQEGSSYYWTVEGVEGRNPRVPIPPSAEITIRVRNTGGVHNLQVQGAAPSEYVNAEGDEVTYRFTSPASGTVQYWCVPHRTAGMAGVFQVVVPGEAPPAGGGDDEEFAGPTSRLGDVLPAAAGGPCADTPVPLPVAARQIGGPSPQDYLDRCMKAQGGGVQEEAGPSSHPVDLVIPISFGLVGLGIVGVVWAHRFYKP